MGQALASEPKGWEAKDDPPVADNGDSISNHSSDAANPQGQSRGDIQRQPVSLKPSLPVIDPPEDGSTLQKPEDTSTGTPDVKSEAPSVPKTLSDYVESIFEAGLNKRTVPSKSMPTQNNCEERFKVATSASHVSTSALNETPAGEGIQPAESTHSSIHDYISSQPIIRTPSEISCNSSRDDSSDDDTEKDDRLSFCGSDHDYSWMSGPIVVLPSETDLTTKSADKGTPDVERIPSNHPIQVLTPWNRKRTYKQANITALPDDEDCGARKCKQARRSNSFTRMRKSSVKPTFINPNGPSMNCLWNISSNATEPRPNDQTGLLREPAPAMFTSQTSMNVDKGDQGSSQSSDGTCTTVMLPIRHSFLKLVRSKVFPAHVSSVQASPDDTVWYSEADASEEYDMIDIE